MIGKGRSKQQRKGGGAGIMVSLDAGVDTEEIHVGECEMSEDVMAARLECTVGRYRENVILIVCYMTVERVEVRAENEGKYRIVERVIVMGDMNGHIGVLGEEVNGNGQLLLDFVEANELEILNVTMAEGRVTWCGRESESVIDYVVVNDRARERVRGMWVDEERKIDVASDHNVMVLEYECVKEKVKVSTQAKGRWKVREADWDSCREAVGKMEWKTGENGLQAERGVDECNRGLVRKLTKAGEDSIGRTEPRGKGREWKRKRWCNKEIDRARKERRQLNRRCRSLRRSRQNSEEERIAYDRVWEEYRSKQQEVKVLIRRARGNEERKIIEELRRKGEEGGREWYRFLRGEEGSKVDHEKS